MRLGRVEATAGFFLLLAWLNYLDRQTVVPLALAACALHELGHCAAVRFLGGEIELVRLTAFGAELVLDRPLGYWQEGMAALAGPGVNLLLALIAARREEGLLFSGLNLALGCFNLLPVGRLDGGRALYCTLALTAGQGPAEWVGERLDILGILLMLAGGLWLVWAGGNATLLLPALWLAGMFKKHKKNQNRTCRNGGKQVE